MNLIERTNGSTFADMANRNIPELTYLLTEVEKKYGRRIATTTDFESLSVVIEHQIGELISSSTLKRLWGYVTLNPIPRIATLDILARYIGRKDFKDFCEGLKESNIVTSTFFSSRCQTVSELAKGAHVTLGWAPNRLVILEYLGDFQFEVIVSENSQLKIGDRFELSEIILGCPLYVSRILRNGRYTPSYLAGRQGGINLLNVVLPEE